MSDNLTKFKGDLEEILRKVKQIAEKLNQKAKKIDRTNPAEVKEFNNDVTKLNNAYTTSVTNSGKKHKVPKKVINAGILAVATALTLSGCKCFIPGDEYGESTNKVITVTNPNQATPGIYKDNSGKTIVVEKDGKCYTVSKDENGNVVKKETEISANLDPVTVSPNETIVSVAENEMGSTLVSQNTVTGVTTITYTDKQTGKTIVGKSDQLVIEDDGRIACYTAQFDENGNAIIDTDYLGNPSLAYTEKQLDENNKYVYTDRRGVEYVINNNDILKPFFDQTFNVFSYDLVPLTCAEIKDRYDSYVSNYLLGDNYTEERAKFRYVYEILRTFATSCCVTISDEEGNKVITYQASRGVCEKYLYLNGECIPYCFVDSDFMCTNQSGKIESVGKTPYTKSKFDALKEEYLSFINKFYPSGEYTIDGDMVTYKTKDGGVAVINTFDYLADPIEYTSPEGEKLYVKINSGNERLDFFKIVEEYQSRFATNKQSETN